MLCAKINFGIIIRDNPQRYYDHHFLKIIAFLSDFQCIFIVKSLFMSTLSVGFR